MKGMEVLEWEPSNAPPSLGVLPLHRVETARGSQDLAEAQGTVSASLHPVLGCVWGYPGYRQVRYMTSMKPLPVFPGVTHCLNNSHHLLLFLL